MIISAKLIQEMLSTEQTKLYRKYKTPGQIQDFLNSIPANFESRGETCMSPLRVLQIRKAHCLEGAMLAASMLQFHGHRPLLMDLRAKRPDDDHVVTLFQSGADQGGGWGALSKSNHAVLRFREPVYKSLRELAMSYFHEYFDNESGKKNLREYSLPLNMNRFRKLSWETTEKDLWEVAKTLDVVKHFSLLSRSQARSLRRAEPVEVKAGQIVEWSKSGKRLVQL